MSLIAETQASIEATRAEVQVLRKRIVEARKREDYYRSLFAAASTKVVDAEVYAGSVREKADALGLGPSYGGVSVLKFGGFLLTAGQTPSPYSLERPIVPEINSR